MKTLTFGEMERLEGGRVACFFAIPMLLVSGATGNVLNTMNSMQLVAECWNS